MAVNISSIRGINLGGWLLMEGYILGGDNICESEFKAAFRKEHGERELRSFERLFRDTFIREDDFKNIANLGANTLRIPFHHKLLESKPYSYSSQGFVYLDKALSWAQKYNLKVILDLHAACGAQNTDWHSDGGGHALLWEYEECRKRTVRLWEVVAERYKDKPALLGYDILNEPVLADAHIPVLTQLYRDIIRAVQAIDKKHIIFLEGDVWAQRIDHLADLVAEKVVVSIHTYHPLDYVFNFVPFQRFPGKLNGQQWDAKHLVKCLEPYFSFCQRYQTEIFVGEFGINWRGGFWGETEWLEGMLKAFQDYNFGYGYWTYKAVAQHTFPDGLYQMIDNPAYVNRQGPVSGWHTYADHWKREKKAIVDFWKTDNFTPNKTLIDILRRYRVK